MKWLDGKIENIPVEYAFLEGNLTLSYHHYFRGEPIDYALISTDQTVRVYAQLTPFPLEAKSEGGCKLSMTLLSPNLRTFVITGEGFKPGETVTTISKSDSEIIEKEGIALGDGRINTFIIDPGVVGKTGGTATFQASSKTCNVTVSYEWGTAMKRVGE